MAFSKMNQSVMMMSLAVCQVVCLEGLPAEPLLGAGPQLPRLCLRTQNGPASACAEEAFGGSGSTLLRNRLRGGGLGDVLRRRISTKQTADGTSTLFAFYLVLLPPRCCVHFNPTSSPRLLGGATTPDAAASATAAAVEAAAAAAHAGYMGSLSVLFYLLTSLTLTLMNKLIFSQFQFPLFVTEFQV